MLLEFHTKNFKSFRDEMVFSMTPAPKQKGLDYSVLMEKIDKKVYKGLSSAVIYGPNAAGKTNIIGAMDVLRSIILRGHIRNGDKKSDQLQSNAAAVQLELIPNRFNKGTPVDFCIKFISNSLLFEYKLSLDLGNFLEVSQDREVLSEVLSINEKVVFSRSSSIDLVNYDVVRQFSENSPHGEDANVVLKIAKNNLRKDELFLTNGFKAIFSSDLVELINQWFSMQFTVFCRADALRSRPMFDDDFYIDISLNEAAKIFGINSNALVFSSLKENTEPSLFSAIRDDEQAEKIELVHADFFESFGTIRFVNLFPLILSTLLHGRILVVDEFDASLHPMALMSIINIFHNDEINKKNAQLIFNTHNPIFLNSNLFRRDEIKFVERNDDTSYSTHYSLSDFGTAGEKGVRNGGDYMKNYFVSQYGAIKEIDFTPVFEELLKNRGEE